MNRVISITITKYMLVNEIVAAPAAQYQCLGEARKTVSSAGIVK